MLYYAGSKHRRSRWGAVMAKTRLKMKGRRESDTFLALPHGVISSVNWLGLSPYGVKLVIDLAVQYKGWNNGDLCAVWPVMHKRGWRSKATLYKAIKEAIDLGIIMRTRQGGRNMPTLYAVTWKPIDECNGKLDVSPTKVAPSTWKIVSSPSAGIGSAVVAFAPPTAIRVPHGAGHGAPPGGPMAEKSVVH
jgi:hypothetical protein